MIQNIHLKRCLEKVKYNFKIEFLTGSSIESDLVCPKTSGFKNSGNVSRKALVDDGMNPSEFSEVQGYPEIVSFLKFQVDMWFNDLRILLRLPLADLDSKAGCNFTTATMLLNIIAGGSVCFYDVSEKAFSQRGDRSERFENLLIKYYPWEEESFNSEEGSELLYGQTRNPLVHSLGLDRPLQKQPKGKGIGLKKDLSQLKKSTNLK